MCNHEWLLYRGLREEFEYCTKCDVRKGPLDAVQLPAMKAKYEPTPIQRASLPAGARVGGLIHPFDIFGSKDIA